MLHLSKDDNTYCVVVPKQDRLRIIGMYHKGLGHIGISKTIQAINKMYYWPNMDFDIRHYINKCFECALVKCHTANNTPQKEITESHFTFERIAIDITGPLVPSKTGNNYILGIIDYYSKFTMLLPTKHIDALHIAHLIFSKWICLFGSPFVIHTDRGSVFESELFRELCRLCGIKKTKTAPYYPQSDGLVERLFRTAKEMLQTTMTCQKSDWETVLPIVEMALRGTVQKTINVSPYEVVFGKTMRFPFLWNVNEYSGTNNTPIKMNSYSYSTYIDNLNRNLKCIADDILKRKKQQDHNNNQKLKAQPLQLGQIVFARNLPKVSKLGVCKFDGPYEIIKLIGKWTYNLRHVHSGKLIDRNIHHIKLYTGPITSHINNSHAAAPPTHRLK